MFSHNWKNEIKQKLTYFRQDHDISSVSPELTGSVESSHKIQVEKLNGWMLEVKVLTGCFKKFSLFRD